MRRSKNHHPLTGKTVVITGASSGVGKAIAEAFAKNGAHLVLAARGEEGLLKVSEICENYGVKTLVIPTDVSDAEQVYQLAEKALMFNNRIDYWVSNAGVLAFGKFEETPIEVVDQVIKTNLLGYIHSAHAVLPVFKRQRKGVLINNISIGGIMPAPFGTAYTASKFGIKGMVESLQGEVSGFPDIHICAVYPGFQKSAGIEHAANYSGVELKTPPPSFDPRDLAASIVKLASNPEASVYPDWFSSTFKYLYPLFPSLIRKVSSSVAGLVIKDDHYPKDTSGNVLKASEGNMEIDGKTLLPSSKKIAGAAAVGLIFLAALHFLKSQKTNDSSINS